MLETEVGTSFRTTWRRWMVCNGRGLIDWRDQSDLNYIRPMGARCLDGLSIIKGIVERCDLGMSGRTDCLTHHDVGIVRTISDSGLSGGNVSGVRCDGELVGLLVWIWAAENIFGTGGGIFGWSRGRGFLVCLCQKATIVPPNEEANGHHKDDSSDDCTRESTLANTTR